MLVPSSAAWVNAECRSWWSVHPLVAVTEELGGAAVRQPGAAGKRASVDGRHGPRRLAIGQEHRAGGAASQEPREQQCRPGLPEYPLGRPALAPDACALVGQIEVVDIERQDLVGTRCRLVQQSPQGAFTERHVVATPQRRDLLARQRPGAIEGDCWPLQASRRVGG